MRKLFKTHFGENKQLYKVMCELTGATPHNIELYKLALIHRSASIVIKLSQLPKKHQYNLQNPNSCKRDSTITLNNERLEFLGDAILQAVISSIVFVDYPSHSEGELSILRAKIVSRDTMNVIAKQLALNKYISTNPPQLAAKQQNILGDAFEALIGALYLDHGFDKTTQIIEYLVTQKVDIDKIEHTERDFKSRILEWGQKNKHSVVFNTAEAQHDDSHDISHDVDKMFCTQILLEEQLVTTGGGRNKKRAEQDAAKKFYEKYVENYAENYAENCAENCADRI